MRPPLGLSEVDYSALCLACRELPPPKSDYRINDYVENVLLTVLDFNLKTIIVERAQAYYLANCKDRVRSHQDLRGVLAEHPNTKDGNTAVSQLLWGYRYWNRIELLRRFLDYLESVGVTDQDTLRVWAQRTEFQEFQGRVKGMDFAIFKWLLMRQGVETIKPDLWVHRFITRVIGRGLKDAAAVDSLEAVSRDIGMKAYELDWRIWDYERSQPSPK